MSNDTIANAVQRGSYVYMYNTQGSQIGSPISAGDGITGFTSATFSVKRGSYIYTYNAKGVQTGSPISAGR